MNGLKRNATPHICDGAEHNEKEDLSLDRYLERLKKFSKILAAPVIDMSTFFLLSSLSFEQKSYPI